jgi:hypothetical protein
MNKLVLLSLALSTLAACAVPAASESEGTAAPVAADPALASAVRAKVDAYEGALIDRDVAAVERLVSTEVVEHTAARGMDLAKFVEKQRNALVNTLQVKEGERPKIDVVAVAEEGDAVRATLAVAGEELKKPFYLVRENGELKVNAAPPGFSKSAPEGTEFGSSNYTVRNDMIYPNPNFIVGCYQGKTSTGQFKPFRQVSVPPKTSLKVSCVDACGWWSGTIFGDANFTRYCDWNAWGPDVILGVYGGPWVCADNC